MKDNRGLEKSAVTLQQETAYESLLAGLDKKFMIYKIDAEGLILEANPRFLEKSGWTPKRVLGKPFRVMFPDTREGKAHALKIWRRIRAGRPWQGDVDQVTKDGAPYHVMLTTIPVFSNGGLLYTLMLGTDRTEERELQRKLEEIAYVDPDTGLMNRHKLSDEAEFLISEDRHFTFVYLSIENFHTLMEPGDQDAEKRILQEFVRSMKIYFRNSLFARIGMNEFAVLTPLGSWFAEGFLSFLDEHPIRSELTGLQIRVSGGIAKYPDDQQSFKHLLSASSMARHRVRMEGGNLIASLPKSEQRAVARKLRIEQKLPQALKDGAIQPVFQPQVDMKTGKIIAAEALVRWEDRDLGAVSPAEMIPVAEDCGLIGALGEVMIEAACRQAVSWQQQGVGIRVSCNSSVREFRNGEMTSRVRDILSRTGCPASLLELEITERFAFEAEAEEAIMHQLKALQEEGVSLALDDFGTGSASFRYMQTVPLSKIKIGEEFIASFPTNSKVGKIVDGLVRFGHSLDLTVVAEGVEDEAVWKALEESGCDAVQGYYTGRPMTASQLTERLQAQH
ncbi:diguanylate cyclase [Bhargavaea cecembensis]|uniref:Diguanylate cyclase n=1 Tax=Bhargavaea cecembensis TaxID=394098 RepID=A0A163FEJ8_9BACL|nr:GGDEF domain-containing phosphodiesterase [Bhargavaea cecembensis]KZE38516.1 diguanylate cyclase [Bhargavaea cecembensis]